MSELDIKNAVTELNEGVIQDVHSVGDLATAEDFELKHTPHIAIAEGANGQTVTVTIGEAGIDHPQADDHFIEWIRLFNGSEPVGEVAFGPGDDVKAVFEVERSSAQLIAQSLCNLHGVWEARV